MAKTSIIAKISFQPGKREEAVTAFKPMFDAVNAEAGTEVYVLSLDDADENVLWVYELYTDADALATHSGSEAMAEMFGSLGSLVAGAPELNVLTPVIAKGLAI